MINLTEAPRGALEGVSDCAPTLTTDPNRAALDRLWARQHQRAAVAHDQQRERARRKAAARSRKHRRQARAGGAQA